MQSIFQAIKVPIRMPKNITAASALVTAKYPIEIPQITAAITPKKLLFFRS